MLCKLATPSHDAGMDRAKAMEFINQSFSGEGDENCLSCEMCQLKFTSFYNKQSHYAGKLHLQSLLQHLEQMLKESFPPLLPSPGVHIPVIKISTALNGMAGDLESELYRWLSP